jgi:membrane protein
MDTLVYIVECIVEYLVVISIFGMIPAIIAKSKGHNFYKWWLFGTFLWIIALVCACALKPYDKTQVIAKQSAGKQKVNKYIVIAAICFVVIGGCDLYGYIDNIVWMVRSIIQDGFSFSFSWKYAPYFYIGFAWAVILLYRDKFAMLIASGICAANALVHLNVAAFNGEDLLRCFFSPSFTYENLAWLLLFAVFLLEENKKWKVLQWIWLLPGAWRVFSIFAEYVHEGVTFILGEYWSDSFYHCYELLNSIWEVLHGVLSGDPGYILISASLIISFAEIVAFICIGLWIRQEALHAECESEQEENYSAIRKKWNRGAILASAIICVSVIASVAVDLFIFG